MVTATRALGAAFAALVVTSGCNGILGIEQATEVDGGAATGGTVTSGGSSGTGGNTGGAAGVSTGGTAGSGTGGTAGSGTGGTAGGNTGGSAGNCGDTTGDPANCGSCGHDCLGGDCVASVCQPLLLDTTDHGFGELVLTSDAAYVVGIGALYRITKTGTETYWVDNNGVYLEHIALVGDHVYFSELDHDAFSASTAVDPPVGTTILQQSYFIDGFWADTSGLYWAECGAKVIRHAALDGTGTTDLTTSLSPCPDHIRTDAQNLYFTSYNYGSVYKMPKSGGTPVKISTQGPQTVALTYDGVDRIYFATFDDTSFDSAIRSVKTDGTDPKLYTTLSNVGAVFAMALDGTTLYFAVIGHYSNDFADGSIQKVDVSGGAAQPAKLANAERPLGIAVDSQAVYWAWGGAVPNNSSRLYRLAK
jgi:hypothetical protein